jgi:uncharacterized membrane protein YhhN
MMPLVFLAVITLLDLVFILARSKVNEKKGLVFKMLSSLSFMFLGVFCYFYNSKMSVDYSYYILLALGFGFLGDFALGIRRVVKRKDLFLLLGLLFFLIGHILYIITFIKIGEFNPILFTIFTITLLIVAIIIGFKCKFVFHNIKYGVISYVLTSSMLFSLALMNLLTSQGIHHINIVHLLASLLFVLSDAVLCFIYFKSINDKTKYKLTILSSILYLFAQNLFAFSLYVII